MNSSEWKNLKSINCQKWGKTCFFLFLWVKHTWKRNNSSRSQAALARTSPTQEENTPYEITEQVHHSWLFISNSFSTTTDSYWMLMHCVISEGEFCHWPQFSRNFIQSHKEWKYVIKQKPEVWILISLFDHFSCTYQLWVRLPYCTSLTCGMNADWAWVCQCYDKTNTSRVQTVQLPLSFLFIL